jgi:hypothetical protein
MDNHNTAGVDLDKLAEKLDRVSRWIDKFPVPTDGATAMMCHLRDVKEALARQAAPEAPAATREEIYTLRRLIECAETLDARPRPMCRDCADENGTCPNSGLECDMRKLFADAKRLHNRLAAPAAQQAGAAEKIVCPGCYGVGTYIGQLDGYDDADCSMCDGAGKIAPPAATTASASIDNDEFWNHVIAYCKGVGNEGQALVDYVMSWHRAALARAPQSDADKLAEAIHAAAVKAGIIEAGTVVSGPQLVMLCNDLANSVEPHASNAGEDTDEKLLADSLNMMMWLYRRLPVAYGKPPFVDAAIMKLGERLGCDDVPIAIRERAAIAASAEQEKKNA